MIKKIFILSTVLGFLGLSAQKTHTVAPKETPYGISRQYGLTIDELYRLNPAIQEGKLNIGDVLVVSKNSVVKPSASVNNAKTGTITLQPKQTIYGITKQYHITEAELRKLNPELDSHMKIGDKVTLPLENINKYADASANVTNVVVTKKQEETVNTNDNQSLSKDFYIVKDRDNYYKISRQFDLTQKQLFELNPGLEEKGLKPGETIRIAGELSAQKQTEYVEPKAEVKKQETSSIIEDGDYVTYEVKTGDTVFGIINKFGVTLEQLLELNPNLSNGLKAGSIIKIKKLDPMYTKKNGDALSVVLMLPFGYNANDTKYRSMALDFLTGAKLAAERNAKAGLKLDIRIIDSGNEATFKNSLTQLSKDNTDLIIGPFFKSNVLEVLSFVKTEKIPVVAPFANSSDLFDYNNLIIIETQNSSYSDRIVKEVAEAYKDQKIYIVADNSKADANAIKDGLEEILKKPNIEIVNSSSEIQLDTNLLTGQSAPVIAILADNDDSEGAAFASRIINLSKMVDGVKAFSMFYNSSFEKNVDDLAKANLVYLMDRKIDNDGSFEKEILSDYKNTYCKAPSKYAVIGFDVMNDMLTRENKKGEIFKQIGKTQTQLATKFEFVRSKPNGAYINTGYRVVRLVE